MFFPLGLSNWVGAWFPFDEGQFGLSNVEAEKKWLKLTPSSKSKDENQFSLSNLLNYFLWKYLLITFKSLKMLHPCLQRTVLLPA